MCKDETAFWHCGTICGITCICAEETIISHRRRRVQVLVSRMGQPRRGTVVSMTRVVMEGQGALRLALSLGVGG
jgi:hypothetical protein